MDYVTRQFISLTKKFRRELRPLLSKLRSSLDKQTEAIRENTKAKGVNQPPTQQVSATVNLPESVQIHHRADEAIQQGNYQKRTLLLSFATFLAVSIYAYFAWLQYCQMIIATGAAQGAVTEARRSRQRAETAFNATVEQFHLDQRAWVSIKDVKLDRPYSLSQTGSITIDIKNSGKTPALDVGVIKVGFGYEENPPLKVVNKLYRLTEGPNSENDALFASVPQSDTSRTIYVRFVIQYWDVFQKRGEPPRMTIFCGYYPSPKPPFFFNSSGCSTMN
jgi:hypothetical protein